MSGIICDTITAVKYNAAMNSVWGLLLAVCGPFAATGGESVIQVVLDLDAARPGFQSNLNVTPTTTVVHGVAVYVLDPGGKSSLWGIGYLGGIDRGIALGHMPDDANSGTVFGEPRIFRLQQPG